MSVYANVYRRLLYPFYEQVLRRRNTLRLLKELEQAQWLPPEQVRASQWERLQQVLRHCEAHVPYYGRAFAEAGVRVDQIQSPEDMARLPLLSKNDVRRNYDDLIACPGHRGGKLYTLTTSGSSGVPVQIALDHAAYERRQASSTGCRTAR